MDNPESVIQCINVKNLIPSNNVEEGLLVRWDRFTMHPLQNGVKEAKPVSTCMEVFRRMHLYDV